ncbi:MAG TPA: PAS domain-containing protein, partial [Burkholderiales bacterium]|nr:PAS domain-containing protein [Burkholderiales bacterium]
MIGLKWKSMLPWSNRSDEIARLNQIVASLTEKVTQQQSDLHAALERRRWSEDALRTSEERYALATRGANDGLWEWDVKDDAVIFSPRWKNLIGFSDEDFPNSRDAWRERVHAADLPTVEAALREYLE